MTETVVDSNTGLMSNAFFLTIGGNPMTMLTGVSGLEVGVEATDLQQTTDKGKMIWTRTLGSRQTTKTLTLTRLAPDKSSSDGIWTWYNEIVKSGSLTGARKHGAVVMYASDYTTVLGQYDFKNGWVSKIALDALDVSSGNPLKETISLEVDSLERTQ